MVEPSTEPISSRCSKLGQIFVGKNSSISNKNLVSREGLLDALFLLYDECNNDVMKKDKHVALFIDKFRSAVSELKKLRVNISDFEVRKIIGRGHFGEVQVVREKQTGDVYAMKILRKCSTLAQQNMAFYEEERDIMAKAQSPWITQLQYAFQDHNNLYLVMEFHPGGDLLALLDRMETLSEEMTRFYMAEIVLAIHSLHTMGYVHRDIKPDNILIDRMGHIKLADFGSAAKLTTAGTVVSEMPVGTPHYIAPEVLSAINSADRTSTLYGRECDWWSLGVVGYEMLCGKTPFADDKVVVTYSNIMDHKNTLKWPEDTEINPEAKSLIRGLLEEVNKRYDYRELCQNKFFSSIDWNNIRSTVPPFLPKVTSQDDTSNFEEFEREIPPPSLDNYRIKKEFCGKNLPFIGFTFTHNLVAKVDSRASIGRNSPRGSAHVTSLEVQLSNKRQEIQELQQSLHYLETSEAATRKELDQIKKQLENKDKAVEGVFSERESLERSLTKYSNDVNKLKRVLELERSDRLSTEKTALQLVSDVKAKWQREKKELIKELDNRKEFIKDIEAQFLSAKTKELKYHKELELLRQTLEKSRMESEEFQKDKLAKVSSKKPESSGEMQVALQKLTGESQSQIAALQQSLKQEENANQKLQLKLQELESTLGHVQRQLKVVETEHSFCHTQVETAEESFKEQLRQAQEKCCSLEVKLQEVEKESRELPTKEAHIHKLEMMLEEERESTRKMKAQITSLESRVNSSQRCLEKREGSLQSQEKELLDRMQDLEHDMRQSANEKIQLRQELQAAEDRDLEQQQRIEEQQNVIKNLEEKLSATVYKNEVLQKAKEEASAKISKETIRVVKEVSSDFSQEKLFLESKISKLETQLDRSRDLFSSEKLKLRAAQEELRKVQQELSDSKIDVRIAQREVKKSHELIEKFELSDKTWESRLKDTEEHINVLQEKQENLTSQIQKLERQLDEKKNDMVRQEEKYDREKSKLECRVQSLEEACKASQELRAQVGRAQGQYDELCRQNKILEDQISILERNKRHHQQNDDTVRNELQEKIRKLANLELNVEVLKTTCLTMEDQLKDYERLVMELQRQNDTLNDEKLSLESELCALQEQAENAAEYLRDAKSDRSVLENRVRDLENKLEAATAIQHVEANTLKEQLTEQKALTGQFHEQLNETETCLAVAEHAQKKYQRKVEILEDENVKLKEEASEMITRERSLRDSNFKLTLGLEEAIEKCEAAHSRIAELENAFETMQVTHEVERIKLEATISQQTKLIDFLQCKAESLGKKKKTLQDKLFGRRAKSPVFDGFSHRREKGFSPKLVTRSLRGDVRVPPKHGWDTPISHPTTPKSRAVLSAILQSPGMQHTPEEILSTENKGDPKPAKERMRHNIPHRFQVALTMRATKCSACLDTIHFGRSSARCQECHIMAHPKCSASLPSTCGLPTGLVQHFRQSMRRKNSNAADLTGNSKAQQQMEGWVKVPRSRNMSWEQRFARLEGSRLCLYDKENMHTNTPTNEVELCPPTGQVIVHSAVTAAELLSTAKSDLPYILKLEAMPHTTCWPGRTLYLMAASFPEKQSWVNALESVTRLCAEQANMHKSAKLLGTTILQLEGENALDLNCTWQLSETALLVGAEEGLFVVELNSRPQTKPKMKLEGVNAVFQIAVIEELDCVIMITESSRDLRHLKLSDLKTAIDSPASCRSSLSSEVIPNTQSCHLFATSYSYEQSFVCAATSEKVAILRWCPRQEFFCVHKELMTAEPSSCIHFTKNSIIVGADKFFEIDLKTFTADEFLDASDSSLAYAVYGTAQVNSFPIAVMCISPRNGPDEFLLCFHEFGIFIDGFGRRTRKSDMKWTRLPLSFAYQAPYLFVAHFSSMEVIEITAPKESRVGKTAYLEVSSPRYLGPAPKEGTVYMATIHDTSVALLCLQGNLAALNELPAQEINDTEDDTTMSDEQSVSDSEFSYTASLLKIIEPSPGDFSEDFTDA